MFQLYFVTCYYFSHDAFFASIHRVYLTLFFLNMEMLSMTARRNVCVFFLSYRVCGASSPENGHNEMYNMCVTRSLDAKC